MGQANARDLGLSRANVDDPSTNYNRVRSKVFDFSFDPEPSPVAATTASQPAQDATPIAIPDAW